MSLVKAGVVIVLAVSTAPALADQKGSAGKAATKAEISRDEAKAIALNVVSGVVKEVEKERHDGVAVYSVEIKSSDGVHEVLVNLADGSVIDHETPGSRGHDDDDDADEDDDDDDHK